MTTIEWGGMSGIFEGELGQNGETYGTFTSNKCTLSGRWFYDAFTGDGTWVYPNNDKYEGEFVNNMRHGKGKYTTSDGSIYDGNFSSGCMNGYGVFTDSKDSSVYEGGWKNNKKHGRGKTTYKSGIVYGGECKDGRNSFLEFLIGMFYKKMV